MCFRVSSLYLIFFTFFFFNDTATTEIYTLSLHDALPISPNLVGAALPLLILAACPLSMLFMARGMQGGQCAPQPGQTNQPAGIRLTRDEQLAELKAQLAIAQTRQQAIAREIAELEAANAAAVREAEEVARAADERVQ